MLAAGFVLGFVSEMNWQSQFSPSAWVTLLACIYHLSLMSLVIVARYRSGIMPPETGGDPTLERLIRVHNNATESLVTFLPLLWLATIFGNHGLASMAGGAWLIGRLLYSHGYARQLETFRRGGFLTSLASLAALVVLSSVGLFG